MTITATTATTAVQAVAEIDTIARGRTDIPVTELPARLRLAGPDGARIGHGLFTATGQWTELHPNTYVVVRQSRVKTETLRRYVRSLEQGADHATTVTDRADDGRLWHLDGLHRLVAARLLGLTLTADIWR